MPLLTVNLANDALGGGVTPANTVVTVRRLNEVTRTVDGVTYLVSPTELTLALVAGRGSFDLEAGFYWVHRRGGPSVLVHLDRDARLDELAPLDPATLEPTEPATVAAWEDRPTREEVAETVAAALATSAPVPFVRRSRDTAQALATGFTVADLTAIDPVRGSGIAAQADGPGIVVEAAGLYLVSATARVVSGSWGEHTGLIFVGGREALRFGQPGDAANHLAASAPMALEAGDIITLRYYCGTDSTAEGWASLSVARLGD